jgi:deazaflavin-dependent oxidoreductase (nitroreductase family)
LPNSRWLLALITKVHRALYVRTHGALGGRALHFRFLLLRHVGRRSGREHATPLLYVEDAGRFVVAASNGGDERPPAWWRNLERHPEARIQVGRDEFSVRAREADGAESEPLWRALDSAYPYYRNYRTRTARRIPVVVLERVGS